MPISTLSGYDASVATATCEELEFPLPIEIPKDEKDDAYSLNIHAVEFYCSAFPASSKYQKWSLRRNTMSTPAYKHEAQDGAVIASLYEAVSAAFVGIQSTNYHRRKEWKIPHNVIGTSLYLEMMQDSGGALEMGARIEFTYKKMSAKTWMWAHSLAFVN